MAAIQYQPPGFSGGQVAISDTPVKLGGALQGCIGLLLINQGSNPCCLWAVMDGSTPSAADVISNGATLPNGADISFQGSVGALGNGSVAPQYWGCCSSGDSTVVAVQERAL